MGMLPTGMAPYRRAYEWKYASVSVAGSDATTNIRTITGFTTLFDTVQEAYSITVEADGPAYIRLNGVSNDKITIGTTAPYTDNNCVVSSLFISTGGAPINITVKIR